MEKFLKFKDDVSLQSLAGKLTDNRIIVLRESKITGTIQIRLLSKVSAKQIKEAFQPFVIEKIYDEFPYPLKNEKMYANPLFKLRKMLSLSLNKL